MEASASAAPPLRLFLRVSGNARVAQSGVLTLRLVSTSSRPLGCSVCVEPARPEDFDVFDSYVGDCWLPPGEDLTVNIQFRARIGGAHTLAEVRVLAQGPDGRVELWEVPRRSVTFEVDAGAESRITIHQHVQADVIAGDISLREGLAGPRVEERAGNVETELALRPPRRLPSLWRPAPPGCTDPETLVLEVLEDGRPRRRCHLRFGGKASFGRSIVKRSSSGRVLGSSDWAWRWLPCRSLEEDPEHARRNAAISRLAGALEILPDGAVLTSSSPALLLEGRPVGPGESERLASGRELEIGLGAEPFLRLGVRTVRSRTGDPDLFFRLAERCSHSRTALDLPRGMIRAVVVRRLDNVPSSSYALVAGAFSVGGSGREDLLVEGAPAGWLWLARWQGALYVFQADGADRTWRRVELGERFACGRLELGLRQGEAAETLAEPGLDAPAPGGAG